RVSCGPLRSFPTRRSSDLRVVRPGGTIAGLEFGVPRGAWRPLWELYVRVGLPAAGAVIGCGWREAGSFLGGSIRAFNAHDPLDADRKSTRLNSSHLGISYA